MVFRKPNPFPMSIYGNTANWPRTQRITSKAKLDGIAERALKNAAIWDEVRDRLSSPGTNPRKISLQGGSDNEE